MVPIDGYQQSFDFVSLDDSDLPVSLILDYVGIVILSFCSVRELVCNWEADFRQLKPKNMVIKVVFNTVSAIYNAFTIIRGLRKHSGYIVYQKHPKIAVYIFSAASILGIVVGAAEDYYKRYSCTQPSITAVFLVALCLTASFSAIIAAQGIFLFIREHPNPGERTIGIVMLLTCVALAIIILITVPFVNKTLLRLSLFTNIGIVPGMMVYLMIITRTGFGALAELVQDLVMYVTYTYPILILTELYVLALISRQRKSIE